MKFFEGDELGGPFDLIFNLPLHPLVVHGAVVLVPLVAFAALAMSYWPSFSRKYGGPVLILAARKAGPVRHRQGGKGYE
ncbi:MAG: hypothetical protein EB069_10360, partial [Actinobacteria bacterium]|nr:hypothetical protein [Actinomycetota bacterium]